MASVLDALNIANDRRKMPSYMPAGDLGSLASALGLKPRNLGAGVLGISVAKDLLPALAKLPYATLTFPSANMSAQGITATQVAVGLQSNGYISFQGQLSEGNISGDNYLIACALIGIKNQSGATPVIAKSGNLSGTLNIGGQGSLNFQKDSSYQAISDNWDVLKSSQNPVQFTLHASTDPWQITEGLLGGFFAVISVDIIESIFSGKCQWSSGDGDDGGQEALLQCG